MVASMWRMNGQWSRMAGVVLLCILLFSKQAMCQDDTSVATDAPVPNPDDALADDSPVTDAVGSAAAPDATAAPDADTAQTVAVVGDSAGSAAPGGVPFTVVSVDTLLDILDGGNSGTTAAPNTDNEATDVVDEILKLVVPDVTCVGEGDIPESDAVNVELTTNDCEETKRIIRDNPAAWCNSEKCDIKIFQNGNMMRVASDDARLSNVAEALQSEHLKDKLGVTKAEAPSSSGSSVFVGILVSGLLAAIGITVGYFKCQRRADTKGVRLAEEAYPVDQENQGNTLVSVAPLNPPPETPEKPSVNGESPEAAKTQPAPPTNGHSTAKTADTEL